MRIKKTILKITSLLLIVGLNCSGLFGVGETMACFNDKEISESNVYTAGTLDFSVHSGQNDFVSETGHKNRATRTAQVHQKGNLPFKYTIRTEIIGDDSDCNNLELEVKLRGKVKYPVDGGGNSLLGLDFFPVDMAAGPPYGVDPWQFKINALGNSQNKTCEFKFIFEGWQDNVENYEENGFDDVEEIENSFSFSEGQNSNRTRIGCSLVSSHAPSGSCPERFVGEAADNDEVEENTGEEETGEPDGLDENGDKDTAGEDSDEVEIETKDTADEEDADVEKEVEVEMEDVDTDEFEIEDTVAVEEDIEDEDTATDDADEEEDAKNEEVVLAPKKGVSLDDDDDDEEDDADDGEDEVDEKEVFEGLELDIKKEIEEINNSDFSQSDGAENNLNKKSVDCVQAVK